MFSRLCLVLMWLCISTFSLHAAQSPVQLVDENVPMAPGKGVDRDQTLELMREQTNAFRKANKLEPLKPDEALHKAAQSFAEYMARTHRYGHLADGREPAQRVEEAGYAYCSTRENIAYIYSPQALTSRELAGEFVQGWKDSRVHRENMLAPFATECGFGLARSEKTGTYFAVQLIARPESARITFRVRNETSGPIQYVLHFAGDGEAPLEQTLDNGVIRQHQTCLPVKLQSKVLEQSLEIADRSQVTFRQKGEGPVTVRVEKNRVRDRQ